MERNIKCIVLLVVLSTIFSVALAEENFRSNSKLGEINITSLGKEWSIINQTGNELYFDVIFADVKDKKTDICFVLKKGVIESKADLTPKFLYNPSGDLVLDNKAKPIEIKYESTKCDVGGVMTDGYHLLLSDAKAVNIDEFIRIGNQTLIIAYQDIKTISYSSNWFDINTTLYKDVNGYNNTIEDLFVFTNKGSYKFGANDSSNTGVETYKYILTSSLPIIENGLEPYIFKVDKGIFKDIQERHIFNFNDICSKKNISSLGIDANCSFSYYSTEELYYLEVSFNSDKDIDPSISYGDFDSGIYTENVTLENNYSHLSLQPLSSIKAYYPFTVDSKDFSSNSFDGSVENGIIRDNCPKSTGDSACADWVTDGFCLYDKCLFLPQQVTADNYFNIPILAVYTNNLTFCTWFYKEGGEDIFVCGDDFCFGGSRISFMNEFPTGYANFEYSLPLRTWEHNCIEINPGENKASLWVNGVLNDSFWCSELVEEGTCTGVGCDWTSYSCADSYDCTSLDEAACGTHSNLCSWTGSCENSGDCSALEEAVCIEGSDIGCSYTPQNCTLSFTLNTAKLGVDGNADYFKGALDEVMFFGSSINPLEIFNNASYRFDNGTQIFKSFSLDIAENNSLNVTGKYEANVSSIVEKRIGMWNYTSGYNVDSDAQLFMSFEEVNDTGSAIDLSINSFNGSADGDAMQIDAGKYGKAFSFDGLTGAISLGDQLDQTNNSFSYSLWIYTNNNLSTYKGLITKGANQPSLSLIASSFPATISLGITNVATIINLASAINADTWYHIAVTRDETNWSIYVDGLSSASVSNGNNGTGNTNSFTIGNDINGAGRFFNGTIDEVMVWNRALSSSEVMELYTKGRLNYQYTPYQSGDLFEGIIDNSSTDFVLDYRLSPGSSLFYSPVLFSSIDIDSYRYEEPDIIAPNVSIELPENGTITSNITLNINYTSTDETALDSCWYSNDSFTENVTIDCGTNITGVTWTIEKHNVNIWARDTSGNENYTSVEFTINPIICGGSLSSNTVYTLVGPLTSPGDCFASGVAISNMTFDCNGYSITGDKAAGSQAFYLYGNLINITIKNCILESYATPLQIGCCVEVPGNATEVKLINNTLNLIEGNSYGILFGYSNEIYPNKITVSKNIFNDGTYAQISPKGYEFNITENTFNTNHSQWAITAPNTAFDLWSNWNVSNNLFNGTNSSNLFWYQASGNLNQVTFSNNQIISSNLGLSGSMYAFLTDSVISDNLIGSEDSYLNSGGSMMIRLIGGNNTVINNNNLYLNDSIGISINPTSGVVENLSVFNNNVTFINDNNYYGIAVGSESVDTYTLSDATVYGNTVTSIPGGSGRHTYLIGFTSNSLIYDNNATGGYYGYVIKGNNFTNFYNNWAYDNQAYNMYFRGDLQGNYYNNILGEAYYNIGLDNQTDYFVIGTNFSNNLFSSASTTINAFRNSSALFENFSGIDFSFENTYGLQVNLTSNDSYRFESSEGQSNLISLVNLVGDAIIAYDNETNITTSSDIDFPLNETQYALVYYLGLEVEEGPTTPPILGGGAWNIAFAEGINLSGNDTGFIPFEIEEKTGFWYSLNSLINKISTDSLLAIIVFWTFIGIVIYLFVGKKSERRYT